MKSYKKMYLSTCHSRFGTLSEIYTYYFFTLFLANWSYKFFVASVKRSLFI